MDIRLSPAIGGTTRIVPWRIELLGGIRARREQTLVSEFRTRRAALLLARLALNPRPHRRDELVAMFWPAAETGAGRQSLSQSLSELRRRLESRNECELVFAGRESVWLDRAMFGTDVEEFELELQRARATAGTQRAAHLERAVAVASAPLLPGVDHDWATASRERLNAECVAALAELASHHEERGELAAAFEFAWRRVRIDPLDEPAHVEFAKLYERAGRPAAGLRHLQVLEQELAAARGSQPGGAVRELADSLGRRLEELARRTR